MKKTLCCAAILLCLVTLAAAQTPAFRWARSAGGASGDFGNGIAVDAAGNSYVTGYFESPEITFGSTTLLNSGFQNIYVVKYDAGGNVVWAQRMGGEGYDAGTGVALDPSGNCYVTGYFSSSAIGFDTVSLINSGDVDMFIVKIAPNGNFLWGRSSGGTDYDDAVGLTVDRSGNVYVTGNFMNPNIIFGPDTLTNNGSNNFYIVKYDPSGNVVWAKSAGDTQYDYSTALAVDLSGNSYLTGYFQSPSITFGSTTLTNANGGNSSDGFIVKYDTAGNVLFAKGFGGENDEQSLGVAVDASGNSCVTGSYGSPAITFGTTTLTNAGVNDMFIAKFDTGGNCLWAKSLGGTGTEVGYSVAMDASGESYVTGSFSSHTLTCGSAVLTNDGYYDIFFVKYDADGNPVWAKRAGGTDMDFSRSIALDVSGNSYVTGYFGSTTIPFGADTLRNVGVFNIFIVKIDGNPPGLVSVKDVANDQGGRAMLHWTTAAIDRFVENTTRYSIWRALPPGQNPPISAKTHNNGTTAKIYRQFPIKGVNYFWEWVANQPAHLLQRYAYAAPTLSDSLSPTNTGMEYFFVSAETNDPNLFYDSNVDSGYSVDNLAPIPPAGLVASVEPGPQVQLIWDSPTDLDVGHYDVYRSTTSGFSPAPGFKIGTAFSTTFTDVSPPPPTSYYRIVAVDIHGNLSLPSAQVSAVITGISDEGGLPTVYRLEQNYPNPFNPTTVIKYSLPASGPVKLAVYNVMGQEVALLVNEHQNAGYKSVTFSGTNLPSGMYTYKITVGSFTDVKRMMFVK